MDSEGTEAWRIGSEKLTSGLTYRVFELVDCMELPSVRSAHARAAELDGLRLQNCPGSALVRR